MGARLVVVGALAAVVSQVKRGLDGLGALRVVGVVLAGPHSGYMSYIGSRLCWASSAVGWRSGR